MQILFRGLVLLLCLAVNATAQDGFETKIDIKPLEGLIAESASIQKYGSNVVVFITELQNDIKYGVGVKVETKAKWVTVEITNKATWEDLFVEQNKQDGVFYALGPIGKYKIRIQEFDPELGPKVTKEDFEIKKGESGPPDTKPPTDGKIYFLALRADGPANSNFTKIMGNTAWAKLVTEGYLVKDKTVSEATAAGIQIPPGVNLPSVLVLRISPDWRKSTIIGQRPLPQTTDEILKLREVK